jgi:hypothetical protein
VAVAAQDLAEAQVVWGLDSWRAFNAGSIPCSCAEILRARNISFVSQALALTRASRTPRDSND